MSGRARRAILREQGESRVRARASICDVSSPLQDKTAGSAAPGSPLRAMRQVVRKRREETGGRPTKARRIGSGRREDQFLP